MPTKKKTLRGTGPVLRRSGLEPVAFPGPGLAPLSASPAQVRAAADELAPLRGRLGGPDLTGPTTLQVHYDLRAVSKAHRMGEALGGDHPAVRAVREQSGVKPEALLGRTAQLRALARVRAAAALLQEGLGDSLALVQRKGLRMARRLLRATQARLDALPPGDPERQRLEARSQAMRERDRALRELLIERSLTSRQVLQEGAAAIAEAEARRAAKEADRRERDR
ncbi:MAG: hypothetical protein RMK29_10460 [Myxococcales bacterium]|nr:hypothetical protein [Myxococcota bacterium]MDW8282125.1 hypothetical protein [Myxococcales bacterium]